MSIKYDIPYVTNKGWRLTLQDGSRLYFDTNQPGVLALDVLRIPGVVDAMGKCPPLFGEGLWEWCKRSEEAKVLTFNTTYRIRRDFSDMACVCRLVEEAEVESSEQTRERASHNHCRLLYELNHVFARGYFHELTGALLDRQLETPEGRIRLRQNLRDLSKAALDWADKV